MDDKPLKNFECFLLHQRKRKIISTYVLYMTDILYYAVLNANIEWGS